MQFGGNFFFGAEYYNYGTNPENVTLKVVGGKLSYASYGMRKIEVAGGELVLAVPTHGDGNWSNYKDSHAGYQIDSIVVRSGAVLSGTTTNGTDAGSTQPILSLAMESGSILKTEFNETVEDEVTTYSCVCLGNVGAATLGGVQLTAAGTTPNAGTVYTVLSAGSVSGTVTADIDDPVGDDKFAWCAKVRPSEVRLMYCNPNPGFAVFVR